MTMVNQAYSPRRFVSHGDSIPQKKSRFRTAAISRPEPGPKPLLDIIEDGIITITPELAERILAEAAYEGQGNRHKTPSARAHILGFAEMMRRGAFHGEANCVYFCRTPDAVYLADGYHRIAGIVEAAIPIKVRVVVIGCEDMRAVAHVYSIYNRQTRPRTWAQVRSAYEVFDEDSPVSKGLRDALHKSIPFILTGFSNSGKRALPPELKTDESTFTNSVDWVEACELYQAAIEKRPYRAFNKKFLNPSVVGVALITLRYRPAEAVEFWGGVFASDLSADDPRSILAETLKARREGRSATTPKGLACLVQCAWEKWLTGTPVKELRVTAQAIERPMRVTGTPYTPSVAQ